MSFTREEIEAIKNDVSLTRAAAFYKIPVTKGHSRGGGNREPCPLCQSRTGFVTTNDRNWNCYSCGQHGDVFTLVGLCTGGNEFSKVIRLSSKQLKKDETIRLSGMAAVFKLYQQEIRPEHLEYFEERGIQLKTDDCGFAPSTTFLQDKGYSKENIDKLGLWSDSQKELFENRIVFPIKDFNGFITHFQGRSLDPNEKLRWKGSKGGLHSIHEMLYNAHKRFSNKHPLFITEGITDTKSLETLRMQALGTLGLGQRLDGYANLLAGHSLYFIYDNTKKPIGQKDAGKDVSWSAMLPSIINLHAARGPGRIYCLKIPRYSGVEDVNDFANYINWNSKYFIQFVKESRVSIGRFALESSLPLELIGKAVGVNKIPAELDEFWARVRREKGSVKHYLLELLC
jgi:hypothetical protein